LRRTRSSRCRSLRRAAVSRRLPHRSGRPSASQRWAPLRTGQATFTASGSSLPFRSDHARPYDPLGVSRGSSAGPLTTTRAAASSLSIGSGVVVIVVFGAHLTTSALFRARAPGPVSGRLSTTASWRGLALLSRFPAAFRRPALASWSSCSRRGVGLSSRSAYRPARRAGRTWTGFPCFARTSCDRGGRPLYPEDNGAHPARSRSPVSVCRFSAACPYAPPPLSVNVR